MSVASMKTPQFNKRLFVFIITILLFAIFSSFLTADIFSGDSNNIYSRFVKFLTILLCFSLTLVIGRDGHDRRDTMLLRLAFLLTAAADFSIGILEQFLPGVAIFFLVQITYIIRHSRTFSWNRREIISCLIIVGSFATLMAFMAPTLIKAGLFLPGLVYCTALAISLWMAIGTIWRKFFPRTIDWFIAIGMVSFVLCDINVALFNALQKDGITLLHSIFEIKGSMLQESKPEGMRDVIIAIPYTLRSIVGILVWFFYLPAQFLLALSGFGVSFLRSIYPLIPRLSEPDGKPSVIQN